MPATAHNEDGRNRAVIERVRPCVDAGRFPIKRTVGGTVIVEADIFTDGHDKICAMLRYARGDGPDWQHH